MAEAVADPTLAPRPARPRIAMVGNPNAGKTTLFNALTGLRAKTANFPGTTIEHRSGVSLVGQTPVEFLDLPGLYSLNASTAEERIARETLLGQLPGVGPIDGVVLLLDATNLERNLYLASQVLTLGLPVVVALNMIDMARSSGIRIDIERLAGQLGCPIVPVVARTAFGVDALRKELHELIQSPAQTTEPCSGAAIETCGGCPFKARYDWAEKVADHCSNGREVTRGRRTERLDRVLAHPTWGVLSFFGVMLLLFSLIFWIAQFPMDWIERGFDAAGSLLSTWLPAGDLKSFVVDGVLGGVGGVLVFLPQICVLFLFLSLLEDTGYLARAAFVMDRLMRRVGLPGKAFVPMVSAHACAIPAVMATRVIEDRRDRLVTILVLPLLTCSARIPVYAMVTALLFPHRPVAAAVVFTGAYSLGIVSAMALAFLFKRTILPGETNPLVLELPGYKIPSLRTALYATWDRARLFVRRAGTVILLISMTLWVLASYPRSEPPHEVVTLETRAAQAREQGRQAEAETLQSRADATHARDRLAHSYAGRLGHWIEPAIRPLGFDWQIGVGVISSFAAREVIVSTLAIVYGVGETEDQGPLYATLRAARRSDGSPVFTTSTSVSLLIFYVLAMQCLPTQAVTRRETGGWRWPLFQLGYMSVLAYAAAFAARLLLTSLGFA